MNLVPDSPLRISPGNPICIQSSAREWDMSSRLATGFALAVTAATLSACLPTNAAQSPRPVTPKDGPEGTVRVVYLGGSFTRRIQARFRLDRAGYVLVGHLGGDGRIRVLYPETPRDRGWVAGGETIVSKPQTAMYDVSPHFFSFAMAPWRSLGAQMDSYDGLGHGYVFMITSRSPIDYGTLGDRDGFETLEIENYEATHDPRYAIRNLADELSTGGYTLKFARDPNGGAYARATGCPSRWDLMAYHPAFGYMPWMELGYLYFQYPGASLLHGIQFARHHGMLSCRGSLYASGFHSGRPTVVIPVAGTPQGPLTPRLQRPARRTLEDETRTAIINGRSAFDRRGTLSSRRAFRGGQPASRPTMGRPERPRDIGRSRPGSTEIARPQRSARPNDGPRMTTRSAPRPTAGTSGGGTKVDRPPRR